MAHVSANIHVRPGDAIRADQSTDRPDIRWLSVGGVAIFAQDAEMRALRDAIDAYLAQSAPIEEAA